MGCITCKQSPNLMNVRVTMSSWNYTTPISTVTSVEVEQGEMAIKNLSVNAGKSKRSQNVVRHFVKGVSTNYCMGIFIHSWVVLSSLTRCRGDETQWQVSEARLFVWLLHWINGPNEQNWACCHMQPTDLPQQDAEGAPLSSQYQNQSRKGQPIRVSHRSSSEDQPVRTYIYMYMHTHSYVYRHAHTTMNACIHTHAQMSAHIQPNVSVMVTIGTHWLLIEVTDPNLDAGL